MTAWRLVAAASVIAAAALSIHVVMLQVIGVPYPDMAGIGSIGLVLVVLRLIALVLLYRLALPVMGRLPFLTRIIALALLDTAITGNMRGAVMAAVVTADPIFPSITLAAQLTESVVLATLIIGSAKAVRGPVGIVAAGFALAGVKVFAIGPVAQAAIGRLGIPPSPELYRPPYGIYVLAWSYVSFLESVAAVLVVAALVHGRLAMRPSVALLQYTALILLLRGTLVMQLLFPWFMHSDPLRAALSTSQFFLQDIALAVMASWAWRHYHYKTCQ